VNNGDLSPDDNRRIVPASPKASAHRRCPFERALEGDERRIAFVL
jgi:hypothetical protein